MEGFIINYMANTDKDRVLLNHTLYGRILYKNYRGRKFAYYVKGILHDKKYERIKDSHIFVENLDNIDIDLLKTFGDVSIEKANIESPTLITGYEHWDTIAKDKGLMMRVKRKTKVKRSSS